MAAPSGEPAPGTAAPEPARPSTPKPAQPDAVAELRELYAFMQSERITEISLETPGVPGRVRLRRASTARADGGGGHPGGGSEKPGLPSKSSVSTTTVTTPISGVFYRSPSPRAKAFVEVGAAVTPGQTLCLVEAMKMMNEIQASARGRIVKILVENGKPVKAGQDLFVLEPA